jgi:2Fe-2S ferredoxin
MPTVIFEPYARDTDLQQSGERAVAPSCVLPILTVVAPEGGSLADLCDANDAPVAFSCRSANCGTCRVAVVEGMSEIAPPEAEEQSVLDLFAAAPHHRLACCVTMRPGLAPLRLRPADEHVPTRESGDM